jgi:hypothetical protein
LPFFTRAKPLVLHEPVLTEPDCRVDQEDIMAKKAKTTIPKKAGKVSRRYRHDSGLYLERKRLDSR